MSDSTPAQPQTGQPQTGAPGVPPLVVNVQYIKDLSFEVPGAPMIYTTLKAAPRIDINLDVQARRVTDGQNLFEVTLAIRAEGSEASTTGAVPTNGASSANGASPGGTRVFLAELSYSGVFTLNNVPENSVEPVLLVECPRILFPFARNILSDMTRDGGFPPVLLQPIDFLALWQSRRQQGGVTAPATA